MASPTPTFYSPLSFIARQKREVESYRAAILCLLRASPDARLTKLIVLNHFVLVSAGMRPLESEDLLATLIAAVEQESKEAERTGREVRLGHGTLSSRHGSRVVYTFVLRQRLQLKDDSVCSLFVKGRRIVAELVAFSDKQISIALTEELGAEVGSATLRTEDPLLLKQLAESLRELRKSDGRKAWNIRLAEGALTGITSHVPSEALKVELPRELTVDQRTALEVAGRHEVAYIWGPPGTGKTVTLAALAWTLLSSGLRVMIVSHTHRAVDGVLEKLCKRISDEDPTALASQSVLRLGSIVRASLESEFGSDISFEQALERSETKIASRLAELRQEQIAVRKRIWEVSNQIRLWDARSRLHEELEELTRSLKLSRFNIRGLLKRVITPGARPSKRDDRPGGDIRESISLVEAGIAEIERSLTAIERSELEELSTELQTRQRDLTAAMTSLERALREARSTLLSQARVIATTTTQAFLRAKELTNFDTIVIDEASMIPLPLIYRLSGMATRNVVIAGDFRQLPPISKSRAEIVSTWYARDVFDAAGIVDTVSTGETRANLAKLTTQFRSHEKIFQLINQRFYGGDLVSRYADRDPLPIVPALSELLGYPIVLIDSSVLGPIGQSLGHSKVNLLHALLVRRLCVDFAEITSDRRHEAVGVITPYRAQVELIEELLAEAQIPNVDVGTVHRFQGEERKVIVLDLTESPPHSLGNFLSSTSLREVGARLLNVALSRAASNLIVVANISFLRSKTRETHVIHGILNDIEHSAHRVEIGTLLAPNKAAGAGMLPQVAATALAFQFFDEVSFGPALQTDIREASHSIVIVSAFITIARTNTFLSLLTSKVAEGVKVVIVIPPPHQNGSIPQESYRKACSALTSIGVKVVERRDIHTKLVCLDEEIVWHGSLNPLSYTGNRREIMTRTVSKVAARKASDGFPLFARPHSEPRLSFVGEAASSS